MLSFCHKKKDRAGDALCVQMESHAAVLTSVKISDLALEHAAMISTHIAKCTFNIPVTMTKKDKCYKSLAKNYLICIFRCKVGMSILS